MQRIVYQEPLGIFIDECEVTKSIAEKVKQCMKNAGYSSVQPNWVTSWEKSLPEVAKALKNSSVDKDVDVAIEYTLKNSAERLDFLIYGVDSNNRKNMVIVELKQWSRVEQTNSLNKVYTMVARNHFEDHFHPSYQALNYAGTLKAFNQYVQEQKMQIEACSFCHNMDTGYKTIMNDISLFPFVSDSPSFLENEHDKLKKFVEKYVSKRCHDILYEIDRAKQIPSDEFAMNIRNALQGNQMYTLDETQSEALTRIVDTVRNAHYYNQKKTIIIRGGAGTGKSIIAINALGILNSPKKKSDRITTFYVTANSAPKKTMFRGLTAGKVFYKKQIGELFKYPPHFVNKPVNDVPCLLIDEAHRIFKWKGGVGQKGGTDALEGLINAAQVAVFFIDDNQAVTIDDYATIDTIRLLARKCHSEVIEGNDLELSVQYRVQGGYDYIHMIKYFLGLSNEAISYLPDQSYRFEVYDDPNKMFDEIKKLDTESREQQAIRDGKLPLNLDDYNGHARVVAGYTYQWVSDSSKRDNVNDVIIPEKGFAKKWNLSYGSGLSAYSWVDDPESVNEIGCIHTCQGVDLDYCGVIIGKDIIYRNGKVQFDKTAHPESDKSGIRTASNEIAEQLIKNTYYVLLTRGIKGTFVFCEDAALGEYLKSVSGQKN